MNRIIGWLISMVVIGVVYGAINLVLVGGQELFHKGDNDKIKEIELNLDTNKGIINNLESKIEREESQLNQKAELLDTYEYYGQTYEYNLEVDEYNSLLAQYKSDFQYYENLIINYNQKIEEVNKLVQDTGTRWYVIPVPSRGH